MEELRIFENENQDIVATLSGRINIDNAEAVEKELFRIMADNPGKRMMFDCEKLEHISSAGLRVLFRIAKATGSRIRVINTQPEVYEIFEDTGFVDLFDVSKPIKNFSLDGLDLIGRGTNGEVYRMDRERIIKVFQKSVPPEEIERERKLARQALLEGIPTAISYTVVTAGGRYGIIFELINADTLSATLKNEPDKYDAYTSQYIQLFKKIHAIKGKPESFLNIKDIYHTAATVRAPSAGKNGRRLTNWGSGRSLISGVHLKLLRIRCMFRTDFSIWTATSFMKKKAPI